MNRSRRRNVFLALTACSLASASICCSPPSADQALAAKMDLVILADEPEASGDSIPERIVSGIEQIAQAYKTKFNEPLPLFFDLSAVEWIAKTKSDPAHTIRLRLKDVPLTEALRGWLMSCDLNFRIESGRIIISRSAEKK